MTPEEGKKLTAEAQRSAREPFRCTECGRVRWFTITSVLEDGSWPEHCGEIMALLPGDEAMRLVEKTAGAS